MTRKLQWISPKSRCMMFVGCRVSARCCYQCINSRTIFRGNCGRREVVLNCKEIQQRGREGKGGILRIVLSFPCLFALCSVCPPNADNYSWKKCCLVADVPYITLRLLFLHYYIIPSQVQIPANCYLREFYYLGAILTASRYVHGQQTCLHYFFIMCLFPFLCKCTASLKNSYYHFGIGRKKVGGSIAPCM